MLKGEREKQRQGEEEGDKLIKEIKGVALKFKRR